MRKILKCIKLQYYLSKLIFLSLFKGKSGANYWRINSLKVKMNKIMLWENLMQ